jgi:hypothetical protein
MIDYIAQSLREVAASAKHNLALVP